MDIQVAVATTLNGKSYSKRTTVSGERAVSFGERLAAAKVGTLTTRTDDNTGELTMNSGHGFVTGDRLDVYWTDSTTGQPGCRRGMTAGTVATNVVPIDGGDGDVLPAAASAVRVMKPEEVSLPLTGDDVQGIFGYGQSVYGSSVVYATSGDVLIYGFTIKTPGGGDVWYNGSGVTNPMDAQTVAKVFLSHGDAGSSAEVRGDVLTN